MRLIITIFLLMTYFAFYGQMYIFGPATPQGETDQEMNYETQSGIWNMNVYLNSDVSADDFKFRFYNSGSPVEIGGSSLPTGTGSIGGPFFILPKSGFYLLKINPSTYEYSISEGRSGVNVVSPKTGLEVFGGYNTLPYYLNVDSPNEIIPPDVNTVVLNGYRPDSVIIELSNANVNGFRLLVQNWCIPKAVIPLNSGNVVLGWGECAEFLRSDGIVSWSLVSHSKSINTSEFWNVTGNSGINHNVNYLGTNEPSDLVLKTDNEERTRITADGNVGIGTEGLTITSQETKLYVLSDDIRQTGYFKNLPGANTNYTGNSYALNGTNESHRNGVNYGGYFLSNGYCSSCLGSNVGLYANATGGNGNIGLVAKSENNNYDLAAHFQEGRVKFDNNLGIRLNPVSNTVLKLDKPSYVTYGANFLFENGNRGNVIIGNGNVLSGGFAALTVTAGQGQQNANDLAIVAFGKSLFLDELAVGVQGFTPGYKLSVDGKIIAEELRIQNSIDWTPWPDYVFEKEYKLKPISELQKYLNEHKHLPEVPSAQNVKDEGIVVGELQITLLKKIEELTLYIIDQQKQIDDLKEIIGKKAN